MILKDYERFVANFTDEHNLCSFERTGFELGKLLGSRYPEFDELLRKKGNNVFTHQITLGNPQLFLSTLAEFCEPLIEGIATAEEPKGGRDAAKV